MMGMNVKYKPDLIGSCTMNQVVFDVRMQKILFRHDCHEKLLSLGMCAEKLCNNKTTRDCCTTLFMSRDLW